MRRLVATVLVCFLTTPMGVIAQQPPTPPTPPTPPSPPKTFTTPADVDLAIHQPDQFAWTLFARINRIAPTQKTLANGKTTNNALWETWADDPLTFPNNPNPSKPPQWPAGAYNVPGYSVQASPGTPGPHTKRLQPPIKQSIHAGMRMANAAAAPRAVANAVTAPAAQSPGGGGSEEVYRNKESFDFIVSNGYYYIEGLAAQWQTGQAVSFPVDAIEVKANWIPITEAQKSQFHWNYDANGDLFGMVATHIISKTIPNWTWATFEWVGNAGRCDYLGCYDTFGFTPAAIAPQTPLGGQYPAGTITPGLSALFASLKLPAEFQNYRLKGTQTDYTDNTGQPTLLGNSVTENGFVPTASCMTCHSNASYNNAGAIPANVGFLQTGQSTYGPPQPEWFWITYNQYPPTRVMQSFDFVWGILRANCAKAGCNQ